MLGNVGLWGQFSAGSARKCRNQIWSPPAHLHLVPRWRISGAVLLIPPICLPTVHRDNFTFSPFPASPTVPYEMSKTQTTLFISFNCSSSLYNMCSSVHGLLNQHMTIYLLLKSHFHLCLYAHTTSGTQNHTEWSWHKCDQGILPYVAFLNWCPS
jgi:hypothetical protein